MKTSRAFQETENIASQGIHQHVDRSDVKINRSILIVLPAPSLCYSKAYGTSKIVFIA